MPAEQEINSIRLNKPLTVFDVWERILNRHEEIVKQSAVKYSQIPHGQKADNRASVLPIERIVWDLDSGESGFYGQLGFQKAIGSQVEIKPANL